MRRRTTTVGDLMTTGLVTLRKGDSVEQAGLDMKIAGIRHIPVVDERRHVVGILSDRDLKRAGGGREQVARVMTRRVLTVTPSTEAHRAARLMMTHKIGSLPVVGDEEQLVGILTETDLLRVAWEALGGRPAG